MPQEPAASMIRLVIADDHRLFRDGVASLLERAADIELVGPPLARKPLAWSRGSSQTSC